MSSRTVLLIAHDAIVLDPGQRDAHPHRGRLRRWLCCGVELGIERTT
jgi:hypothetical protein